MTKKTLKRTLAFISSIAMLASACTFNILGATAYEPTFTNSRFIHVKDFEKYREEISQEEDEIFYEPDYDSVDLIPTEFTDTLGRTYTVYDRVAKIKGDNEISHEFQTGLLYLEMTLEPNITVTQEMLDEIEALMPKEEMGYDFYEEIYYEPKKGSKYENYYFSGYGTFIKGEEPVRSYYTGDDLEPENELAHTLIIVPHIIKYASDYLDEHRNEVDEHWSEIREEEHNYSYVSIPDVDGKVICGTENDYDGKYNVSNPYLVAIGREDLIYSGQMYDVNTYEDTVKKLCGLDFICDENKGRLYNMNGIEEFRPYYGEGWYNAASFIEADGVKMSIASYKKNDWLSEKYAKYLEKKKSSSITIAEKEKISYKLDYNTKTLYADYNKTTGNKPNRLYTKGLNGENVETVGEKQGKIPFLAYIKNLQITDGIEVVSGLDNLKYLEKIFVPDSVTFLPSDLPVNNSQLTIIANKGTYAEEYAKEYGINFVDAKEYSKDKTLNNVDLNSTEPVTEAPTSSETAEETSLESLKFGDINLDGDVTIADAVILNKYLVGSSSLSEASQKNADCDKDGKLTSSDTLVILDYVVGSIDEIK